MIYQYLVLTQGPIDLSVWQNKPNQDRKKEAGIHLCDTEDEYTMLDFRIQFHPTGIRRDSAFNCIHFEMDEGMVEW